MGLAGLRGQGAQAAQHLADVNGWDMDQTQVYIDDQFDLWHKRSQHPWNLDISWLEERGVEVQQSNGPHKDNFEPTLDVRVINASMKSVQEPEEKNQPLLLTAQDEYHEFEIASDAIVLLKDRSFLNVCKAMLQILLRLLVQILKTPLKFLRWLITPSDRWILNSKGNYYNPQLKTTVYLSWEKNIFGNKQWNYVHQGCHVGGHDSANQAKQAARLYLSKYNLT